MRQIYGAFLIAGLLLGGSAIALPSPGFATTSTQLQRAQAEADRLFQQGIEQYQAKQLDSAVQSWQQALAAYRKLGDRPAEATTLKNLSVAYLALGNPAQAIATLQQALAVMRQLGDSAGTQAAWAMLAEIYTRQGNYAQAIESYRQGLALAQQRHDRTAAAVILGNLAIAYRVVGNYGAAIEANQQALQAVQALADRSLEGKIFGNLGNVYEAVGDYDQAISAYEQSLKLARHRGDRKDEETALGNLGAVYANLGQYDKAIALQEQSLQISQSLGDRAGQASTLINLGSTYHSLGQRQKALQYYQQALQQAQAAGDRLREGEALGSLGLIYEDLKQYPRAIAHLQSSLAIARSLQDPDAEGLALNNLGHALLNAGKLAEAEAALRQAVQILDALRPGLSDRYRVSIFDTQIHTYSLLQQILVAANKPEAALEAAEQGRARAFVELLTRRFASDRPPGHSPPQPPPSVPPVTLEQIRQVARQQNATLVEYALVPDDDFKFRGKQQARDSELFIWVVQPTGTIAFRRVDLKPLWQKNVTLTEVVQVARCLAPGQDCGTAAQALRGVGVVGASNPPQETGSRDDTQRRRKQPGLRKLYDLLIQPIADLLPHDPNAHVVLIPQESLFLVPFAALQTPEGQYLIEQHTLLTAPAIQVLALTQQERRRNQALAQSSSPPDQAPVLIVGNPTMPRVSLEAGQPPQLLTPLPGAEQEAIAIAKLLKTTAITGNQATKAQILPRLATAQWVHLATHGLLEYGTQQGRVSLQGLEVPGAIALAPTATDSGLLTANEILNLHLNADLVVLSACDTGQGRITGDGVIGLSRAFISAGVPSVVVSLWAVPDAPTAELMLAFYQALQHKPDKASALRQAMLTTLQQNPRPLDWAAFTLIGEPD